ncbi:hypothetical protein HPG69_002608 [Diceros bicornis minor]|uniref:Peptidase C1A papain C-terminal domain-containing protein n=1 Tax=Diceros bicornis minor TaxID=77932 RepID=A0A7J7EUH8_DICBM|nr:hypothetical protein HPG69_002608 [Diceros bicornis minor]
MKTISDQVCIHTHENANMEVPADNLVICCVAWGWMYGGFPSGACNSWTKKGSVSGGFYDSHVGCRPYSIPRCEHHFNGSQPPGYEGEETLPNNKHYSYNFYSVPSCTMITADIYKNGPVEGALPMLADFLQSKPEVQHVTNEMKAGHTICILGWRVENATPYWLAVN